MKDLRELAGGGEGGVSLGEPGPVLGWAAVGSVVVLVVVVVVGAKARGEALAVM